MLPTRPQLRLATRLSDNAGVVALCAFWIVMLLVVLPQQLVQDSWLTLLSGREIAQHGLPATDQLTIWTQDVRWVDQQWLAQVVFYGLYVLGGVRAVLLTHVVVLAATAIVGVVAARRLGASQASVTLAGIASLGVAPWGAQLRSQTFAQLLFVVVLWLLAADSRRPSRRVYFVLPLVALWANVHGTVVLGAALVTLRGIAAAFARARGDSTRGRGGIALLTFAPAVCVFASPYGSALVGYYHQMFVNPALRNFIDEWGPSAPSHKTRIFYALAFATVWLLGRYRGRLTSFEQLALIAMLLGGLVAIRSIVWFGLAALVLLPQLLDGALAGLRFHHLGRRAAVAALAACGTLVIGVGAFAATRPTAWYLQAWPGDRAQALVHAAACSGSARVFADDRYADWLLFTEPALRGRVAYDVRFELFDEQQFEALSAYRNRVGDDWRRAANGYDVVVFDPTLQERVMRGLLRGDRLISVYDDATFAVLARPATQRTLASASTRCGPSARGTRVSASPRG